MPGTPGKKFDAPQKKNEERNPRIELEPSGMGKRRHGNYTGVACFGLMDSIRFYLKSDKTLRTCRFGSTKKIPL